MSEALEQLLRLVAEGKLSPEDAAPLVAALDDTVGSGPGSPVGLDSAQGRTPDVQRVANSVRIEVRDHGRRQVDLRVPLGLGHAAVRMVPGLAPEYVQRIREALAAGVVGPILDLVDEDGDGVRITLD